MPPQLETWGGGASRPPASYAYVYVCMSVMWYSMLSMYVCMSVMWYSMLSMYVCMSVMWYSMLCIIMSDQVFCAHS